MELPDVGKQCERADCKQLDFLPFTCRHCAHVYCGEHWRPEGHACARAPPPDGARTVTCDRCGHIMAVAGRDPARVLDAHQSDGCRDAALQRARSNVCSVRGCKRRELTPVLCQQCLRNYCLRHRLEMDHACAATRRTIPDGEDAQIALAIERSLKPVPAPRPAACALS